MTETETAQETIGERIRRIRLEKGVSQRELTKMTIGVSYAYLSRIETNDRKPSVSAIRQIARALGVSAVLIETGSMEVCPHCGRKL